jgi:hypothetical protein
MKITPEMKKAVYAEAGRSSVRKRFSGLSAAEISEKMAKVSAARQKARKISKK